MPSNTPLEPPILPAAGHQVDTVTADMAKTNPRIGEFPFPITKGTGESQWLTWLRNHSNYMAVGGMLDYARAIGVLVRGVLINFLIFLPYILGVSLLVAAAYIMKVPPFIVTKVFLGLFVLWILIFAVMTPLFRLVRYQKSRTTGSDSSVGERNKYERSFGVVLLATISAVALESLPVLLNAFHKLMAGELGLPTLASILAAGTAVFSVAPKLLSILGAGVARTLALILIGSLGVLIPVLVVLYVSNFVVFTPIGDITVWITRASFLPLALILVALLLGTVFSAFKRKDTYGLVVVTAISVGIMWLAFGSDQIAFRGFVEIQNAVSEKQDESIASISGNPERLEKYVDEIDEEDLEGLRKGLRKLGTDYVRRAANKSYGPGWLKNLADAGEKAGLYPEFGPVVDKIEEVTRACDSTNIDCDAIHREIGRLASSAGDIRTLSSEQSFQDMIKNLMILTKADIESLRAGEDEYPELMQTFTENEKKNFLKSQEIQKYWGDKFDDFRRVIIEPIFAEEIRKVATRQKFIFVSVLALQLWFFCWLAVDVNLTSIHGLYRDRLAAAFLVGASANEDLDLEKDFDLQDIDLMEICDYDAGSTAPYHLINVALNLQGSKAIGLRDRQCDFFFFSKKFIGGERTGFCRSETMESVYPQMDLATAMAISAAAAAPNMGRGTNPALVAIMTLLNIRLGFWVPNPGALEKWLFEKRQKRTGEKWKNIAFGEVYKEEMAELRVRWANYSGGSGRDRDIVLQPSAENRLVGIGYSGGGIRSATLNLGITQALYDCGMFDHIDYMSTVSGGGYLGSSISSLMRCKSVASESTTRESRDVAANEKEGENSAGELFYWRAQPLALVREIIGKLDENSRLVNVSDGGHIENLAGIELLRRRCKYIIIGDGEADPDHHFNGLATLIRSARIDLGVHIDINVNPLRLTKKKLSQRHWAIGRIRYPGEAAPGSGYILYLKSSVTGGEDEVIQEYRHANPMFPHESTADQFFSEAQFEAYRSLGQRIGQQVFYESMASAASEGKMSFEELEEWFERLWAKRPDPESTGITS